MKRLIILSVLSVGVWLAHAGAQQAPSLPADGYVPGEIIVKFARGVSAARRNSMLASRSSALVRRFSELDLDHVRLPPGRTVVAALAELRANPDVEFAQPNYIYQTVAAPGPPNDPFWLSDSLWGLQKIAAREAWQAYGGGNGSVIVADIDTGVWYGHPDLSANMWRNPREIAGNGVDDDLNGYVDDVFGIDAINHDSDPIDDHGHGTHTAGTIAAAGNNGVGVVGVNWNAKILACKSFDAAGHGTDSEMIQCFSYIVALKNRGENIRVSSNSWGGYRDGSISQALKNAVDAAGNAGILNVFAAGNDGRNIDVTPFDPASFTSSSVLSVAASDESDNRAGFSNYGVTSVDVAAPGVSILSTTTAGYGHMSGTSMATPHVAGVAALVSSLDPTLSLDNLKVLLLQNADVLPQWAGLTATAGRLNAFRAAAMAAPAASSAEAVFVSTDASTQGNWMTAYGSDGYAIVNDATSLPAYATLTPAGHSSWTWASTTSDTRALQRAAGGRIAATWYSSTALTLDLNVTGTETRRVAIYCIDFDNWGRQQRVDVLDAGNGTVLDSRTISSFTGGRYLSWNIRGHVVLRLTNLSAQNAVVSGVFFGGASPGTQPPTVALTSPASGATFAPGALIPLAAQASDPDGTVSSVAFYANGQLLGTDTSSPFSFDWITAPVGGHTLTAVATDNNQHTTTSAPIGISVTSSTGAPSVAFAGTDASTQGNWTSTYGTEGYAVVNDATSLPAYATLTPGGHSIFTWASTTSDTRALQRVAGGRIAATWYSSTALTLDLNVTGTDARRVGIYCIDFDSWGRQQRVDVLDAGTGTVLDTRTLSNFVGGVYLNWNIRGHVVIRLTNLGPANAVVSGVFFGGPPSGTQPPTVAFAGADASTLGNWTSTYGSEGYAVVNDATSLPAYATLTPGGHSNWTWASTTSDARALQRVAGGRIAATWYSFSALTLDLSVTGTETRRVGIYCIDFDNWGRQQRVEVLDAANGTVLDTRTVSNFVGGIYLNWNIRGHVVIRLTNLGPANAVVSGVFFGGPPSGTQPPLTASSTITLRTDFVGTLGAGGNATSPIAAGPYLLLLKQLGSLSRWDGAAAQEIMTRASAPAGVVPVGDEAILNVAANAAGTSLFVMFTSSVAPAAIPAFTSPRAVNAWQVLCRYSFNGTVLSNPQAIVALQVNMYGHTGGGMVVLDDGTVLFATGDNGDSGEDGRQYAQDATNHLSKILRINPSTSAVNVLAVGVRNVQRLFVNPNGGDPRLEFADLGGAIAEELNSVRLVDLLAAPIDNFGWGRNAGDSLAREGTFYIDSTGAATGAAPAPEAAFIQPAAQFGREGAPQIAITGTVSSTTSFSNITSLFGDLPSGSVLAVLGVPGTPGQTVYRVNLVNAFQAPVTLAGLAGGRPDPRFFQFPDGTAGVLLELTGAFYRLTQISQ